MVKYYRGDVIQVVGPDGKGGHKPRPVVVYQNSNKNNPVISVYCTTQNNGDNSNNILVCFESAEGIMMGLTEDTYIRPNDPITIPAASIIRKLGKCNLIKDIETIIQKKMAGGR